MKPCKAIYESFLIASIDDVTSAQSPHFDNCSQAPRHHSCRHDTWRLLTPMIKEKCLIVCVMDFKLDNYGFEIVRFKEPRSPTATIRMNHEMIQCPILSSKTRTTSLTDFGFPVEYKDIRRRHSTAEAFQQANFQKGFTRNNGDYYE